MQGIRLEYQRSVTKIIAESLTIKAGSIVENSKAIRISGFLYLGVVITGIFSLMYVPNKLIVYDNAALTFQNITAFESLFRLGIISGLICYLFFLFLPLFLYKALRHLHEDMAKLMVVLAILSVPMFFINVQNELMILSLIKDVNYVKLFTEEQLQSQLLIYMEQYDNGMRLVHLFSGLWLFPLGYLALKSNFIPKILGVLLMMGCVGYLVNFFGSILIIDYYKLGISSYIRLPASVGEIGTCLWLLIIGLKGKNQLK